MKRLAVRLVLMDVFQLLRPVYVAYEASKQFENCETRMFWINFFDI